VIRDFLKAAHNQVPDVLKLATAWAYTAIAAITTQQENIAWAAQVFMWLSAGVLSLVSVVSIIIRTLRKKEGDN
jgi:sensor c-di-GMP phosphodiesterase-like protein